MNVIVTNEQQGKMANLDVDIIKSITGSYSANELVEMFKNFCNNYELSSCCETYTQKRVKI